MSSSDDGAASPSSSAPTHADRSQLLAQAIRFLTSARVTGDATDETKREFLRSKGLTEQEIQTVFRDAKSPVTGASPSSSSSSSSPAAAEANASPASGEALTEEQAFERAAREFDDPIHATSLAPPARTYPKSPLALYYEAPNDSSSHTAHGSGSARSGSGVGSPDSPLTRYQVLLQFFKTLSYMMMLGGGFTALAVALWRSYVLPRITATFDARSIALKHHLLLFDKLRSSVLHMATYLPASSVQDAAHQQQQQQRKGVLKKVHFGDEVDGGQLDDSTASRDSAMSKSAGPEAEGPERAQMQGEKMVLPGTDVEVEATVSEKTGEEGEDGAPPQGEEAGEVAAVAKLEPIDLTEPLRKSISHLASVLKADMSSTALGLPIGLSDATTPEGASATSRATNSPARPRAATVTDGGSDSGSEWSDSDADTASDDGLEFDPYGSYNKKKHTQASTPPASSGSSSTGSTSSSLRTSLASLSAEINSRQFGATYHSYASSTTGLRFGALPSSSSSSSNASAGATGGSAEPRSGEIGQVKAEIRSLKGLLLSRRNFPGYATRPPVGTQASQERAASTVV